MINNRFLEVSPQMLADEPMSRHTSFKIGGKADMFVSVRSEEEISALISLAKETGTPYMIMGNGSNMLVGDGGIRGLVIQIGKDLSEIKTDGVYIEAQAGALLSRIASEAAKAGLTGLEPLSGIPGTLGGGIYMNAGAYGGEIKDVVRTVRYIDNDGAIHEIDGSDCCFGYRHSIFSGGGMYIISAVMELAHGDEEKIRSAMADYNKRRCDKQPVSVPSAGSTFKRPEGYFAGKLIQDAGLMGYSVGGAAVSEKHAGFVVNNGGATAKDVLELIEHIQKTVKEKFGVELEPEVRLIGEK